MWKKVYIEDIGKTLKDNAIYLCRAGNRTFKARFCYCPEEYWWLDPETGKSVHVNRYKVEI